MCMCVCVCVCGPFSASRWLGTAAGTRDGASSQSLFVLTLGPLTAVHSRSFQLTDVRHFDLFSVWRSHLHHFTHICTILYFSFHTYVSIPFGTFRRALLLATAVWVSSSTDPSFVFHRNPRGAVSLYDAHLFTGSMSHYIHSASSLLD